MEATFLDLLALRFGSSSRFMATIAATDEHINNPAALANVAWVRTRLECINEECLEAMKTGTQSIIRGPLYDLARELGR